MNEVSDKPALTGIDGVYIPVSDRAAAERWYMTCLGLEHGGDYLLAGRQEVFLRKRLDKSALTFETDDWPDGGERYGMPFVCFRTNDLDGLYRRVQDGGTRVEAIIEHSWFREFDLYDPDGNKLKIWQPKS